MVTRTPSDATVEKEAQRLEGEFSPRQLAELARRINPRGYNGQGGEMSADEYRQFTEWLAISVPRGFSDDSLEAGRLVFVEGASIREAQEETGLTQQYASRVIAKLRHFREEAAKQKPEMTADQYAEFIRQQEKLGGRRPYSQKAIEAGRLVFVEAATLTRAAELTGQSRQAVNQCITRMRRRMESLSPDWVPYTALMPQALADEINATLEKIKGAPLQPRHYWITTG